MFLKFLFNPFVKWFLFVLSLGFFLAQTLAFFVGSFPFTPPLQKSNEQSYSYDVVHAFALEPKKVVHKSVVKKQEVSHEYVLKDFRVLGIMLDESGGSVMVKDGTKTAFVAKGESYKGYELVTLFAKKVKFHKGVNFYWAFLDADDEKSFLKSGRSASVVKKNELNEIVTVSRAMREEIKFKNGKYFIPKSLLENMDNLGAIFREIGIQQYLTNGKISFKVTYVASGGLFSKLGLRRGDFIETIDGKPFKSFKEPLELFQNIKKISHLVLGIRRGGSMKELKYEVY